MADNEKQELKEKIKASMLKHLTSKGFNQEKPDKVLVLNELKNMWIKLEEGNLLVEGMDYGLFCQIAHHKYMMADLGSF